MLSIEKLYVYNLSESFAVAVNHRKQIPRTDPNSCCLPFNIVCIQTIARIPAPIHRALRVSRDKFRTLRLGECVRAVLKRLQQNFWCMVKVSYLGKLDTYAVN